ncbi:MAG TPA: PA14 domain-containing protein [Planctomycetota bacterium]|jgi:TolA-binding protein
MAISRQPSPLIGRGFALLALLLIGVGHLMAGPIEDAKKLLDEKKYDEVDKALEKILAQKDVPADALRISLDAAIARGRVITAQQRVTALLKVTQNQDAALVYLGAGLAEQAGEDRLALSRYLAYVKAKSDKDEKTEQALRYVLTRGAYPEEYQKYVTLFGKSDVAWALGAKLAAALLASDESAQGLALCDSLMADAKRPSQVSQIHWLLWDVQEKGQLGADPESRWVKPLNIMLKYRPDTITHVENFIVNRLFNWDKCAAEVRAEMLCKAQEMWKARMSWNLVGRFNVIRDVPDDGKRLAFGKRFLSFEQYYQNDPDINAYREYLQPMAEMPQVFAIQGKELVSGPDMIARFDRIAKNFANDFGAMNHFVSHIGFEYVKDPAAQIDFIKKHAFCLPADKVAWLVGATKGENADALIAEMSKGRDGGWVRDLNMNLIGTYNQLGKKDQLLAAARAYLEACPGNFNWPHVKGHFADSQAATVEEKVAILQSIQDRGGSSAPMKQLVNELDKDKKNWGPKMPFQKLKSDVNENGKAGSDPLMTAHVALCRLNLNQNSPPKENYEICKKFLDDYKGEMPTGNALQDTLLGSICYRHFEAVWNNRTEIDKAARLWAPRLKKGFCWDFMTRRVREHNSSNQLYSMLPLYFEQVKDGPGDPQVWANLASATNPKADAKTSVFAPYYEKMGFQNAIYYITHQQWLDNAVVFEDLSKIVSRPEFPFGNPALPRELSQFVFQRTNNQQKPPVAMTQVLWKTFLAQEEKSGVYEPGYEAMICGQFTRAERWPEAVEQWNAFLASMPKRTPLQQVQAIASVLGVMPREQPGELKTGGRCAMLIKELKPRLEKLAPAEWASVALYQDIAEDLCEMQKAPQQNQPAWPEDVKTQARALGKLFVQMLANGTRYEGKPTPLMFALAYASYDAIGEADWPRLSRVTQLLSNTLVPIEGQTWDNTYKDVIQPLVQKIKEKEAFEIGFVFLDQALKRTRMEENCGKQVAVLKAELARAVPDVVVQKNDPAYELHAAARALALGGETRAWELTQPKLPVFKKLWAELDPGFVAWALEQMRKQKMVKDSLEMCFTVLLRELDLDPEIAASIILIKGDCYCDMQNFQAARIEYEGLKNNKRYSKSESGAKAKYRLIALMILTKDYTRAEELLQNLVDSDNVDTQAEAYFLYAKMSYEQQQYEEARKHLAEVFKRKMDHVEGKLLEGELRLLVRGGLASTEVEAGTPELGKIAIPGLPLTLKLQDQNLAISQGGQAVRVLVTTSSGGDEEKIDLHAAAGTRDVFSATIPTALGKIVKGDRILQLRGDDTISYVIDPEYQKAHAINYPPKTLTVRYDPRLMSSAGEILSEEEQEKREYDRRQRQAQGTVESVRFTGRDERTVRPGSPIYVQITDLAQDLTDAADVVRVTAKTTSGDTMENVEIKETAEHTGIFRGQIPTGIPQPRVTVSDTEEGKNPGIIIKAGNQEKWNSVADGVRPKWLEVDTMSSHLVKSVAITVDPKAIKSISLQGMLADEYAEIAAYPQRAVASGQGLTGEYRSNTRDFSGAPTLTRVDPTVYYPGGVPAPKISQQNFTCRWTGRVTAKYSENYTFYTISDDGCRLWVGGKLLVDDWTTHGAQEARGTIAMQAGMPVDVKIEYFQGEGDGTMQFYWSSKTQKRELVPQSCLLPAQAGLVSSGGTVRMTMCSGAAGGNPDPDAIRNFLKTQPTTNVQLEQPIFDRALTPYKGRQGWMTNRVSGVFYVKEAMDVELRFLQKPSPGTWQTAHLFLDGRLILGGTINSKTVDRVKKETLSKGPHRMEILLQDNWENSQVAVGYKKAGAAGEFEPLPDAWFSMKENPEIEPFLRRGSIETTPNGFVATLSEPERLRKVKWVFEDFAGNAVSVQTVTIKNSKDEVVLPVIVGATGTEAGATGKKSVLEVAPGDHIEISYSSQRRIREDTPVLTAQLNSSFFNGTVMFANEVIKDDQEHNTRQITYQPAKRCRVGDTLAVIVQDNDCDLTDERDTVPVTIKTTSGATLEMKALETWPDNPAEESRCKHSGFFLATLKIGDKTDKDTIGVKTGDMLTVSYLDKENTNPGIPFERTYSVEEAGRSQPDIIVYRTRTEIVEDTSAEAKAKLERLKMRGAQTQGLQVFRTRIVAQHPDWVPPVEQKKGPGSGVPGSGKAASTDTKTAGTKATETKAAATKPAETKPADTKAAETKAADTKAAETKAADTKAAEAPKAEPKAADAAQSPAVAIDVGAPILFEVIYPRQALNSGSSLKLEAVSESEIQAAAKANRKPKITEIATVITPIEQLSASKGYPIQVQRPFTRNAKDMLQEGCFSGVVRLQIGNPGDPVDDLVVVGLGEFETRDEATKDDSRFHVPTILVSGSDVVHLKAKDEETGKYVVQDLKLLSDARLEIMDSSYSVMIDAIHLGESFFLRLTDPDKDVSNDRDKVTVAVSAASGGSTNVELTETLPHSGIFTGALKPEYSEGPAAPGALRVKFGDEITFTFHDDDTLKAGEGMDVLKKARIHYGANGEIATFSKVFSDPEMAVKTRFLMAEALFEMAKEHRKLKQDEKATEEIDKGKRILEEAMRDYPNTSLVAQGEFLLANLAQELGNPQEAIGRYANVISQWPESEYAVRSQFKMAICQEKMGNFDQACENYVRVIYIYPDSELVADAKIRLGNYYYKEKQYKIAAKIFSQFQKSSPQHPLASKTLFLAGQCYIKNEDWKSAIDTLDLLITSYQDQKDVRSEGMYWLGEAYAKANDFKQAYRTFKKITWDYPESKWAKIARGRLTEEVFTQIETDDSAAKER